MHKESRKQGFHLLRFHDQLAIPSDANVFPEPVTLRCRVADVSTVSYQHRRGIADFSELLQRALKVNGTYINEALHYTKHCAMFS